VAARLLRESPRVLQRCGRKVGPQLRGGSLDVLGQDALHIRVQPLQDREATIRGMSDDLDRVAPRESAHAKARDKKVRGPKVIAVNPGLKKLAQHLADKRRKKAKA
jgi:hypothetical protein